MGLESVMSAEQMRAHIEQHIHEWGQWCDYYAARRTRSVEEIIREREQQELESRRREWRALEEEVAREVMEKAEARRRRTPEQRAEAAARVRKILDEIKGMPVAGLIEAFLELDEASS